MRFTVKLMYGEEIIKIAECKCKANVKYRMAEWAKQYGDRFNRCYIQIQVHETNNLYNVNKFTHRTPQRRGNFAKEIA